LRQQIGRIRYPFEALLSLNVAFIFKLTSAETSHSSYETGLRLALNRYLHLPPYDNFGAYTAFLTLAFGWGVCFFAVLRLCSKIPGADSVLVWAGGFLSLGALPAYCLYVFRRYEVLRVQPNPSHTLFLTELFLTGTCVALYLYGRWPIPSGWSVGLLIMHHAIWGWLLLSLYLWSRWFLYVIPVSGACASLLWAVYTSSRRVARAHSGVKTCIQ